MRPLTILVGALSAGLAASSSHAVFDLTFELSTAIGTYTNPPGGTAGPAPVADGTVLSSIDVYALNDGVNGGLGSGSGVWSIEMRGTGLPTLWSTAVTGAPIGNNYDSANGSRLHPLRSYVTAEDVTDGDPAFLSETWGEFPTGGHQPAGFWGNQGTGLRTGSVNPWGFDGTANGPVADATLNGGKGLLVAHIVVAGTGDYTLSAGVGGSIGPITRETRSFTITPEPASLAAVALALPLLGGRRRRA